MATRIVFVTGTDTGVGKTVFAALLTHGLRTQGLRAAALKPICSGGRSDAQYLYKAAGKSLALDELNPWYLRAPLSPLLAARMEHRRVAQAQVVEHVRAISRRFDIVIVEGAGGLLSPLGEGFNSRDLIVALRATPVVVCLNRLGAVNQVLLVLAALPRAIADRAQIVLTNPRRRDLAARMNARLLLEFVEGKRTHTLGWLGKEPLAVIAKRRAATKLLHRVLQEIGR